MKTNRFKQSVLVLSLAAVGLLNACGGGGGDAGTPPFGSGGTETGGGTTAPITAANLLISVDKAQIVNSGSDAATVTVTAIDASNRTLPDAAVTLSANSDSVISTTAGTTDSTGKITGTIGIGNNKANRAVTITATSGSVTKTIVLSVTGSKLDSVALPATVNAGQPGTVKFTLADTNSTKIAGQAVQILAPNLVPPTASGVTDANGEFAYAYTAPAGASGSLDVTATAGGVTQTQVVQIKGTVVIPDVTGTITSASVSANPSVVGVNQVGSNANRAEVRALFLGADNKPIPNVRVRLDTAGDVNSVGGTFASGTELLYSNVNGVATSAYIPASRSSPIEGVTVRACYGPTDASLANNACPSSAVAKLTVSAEPLGVTIGTDNVISIDGLTYVKKYVVAVVDASGRAMPDVDIAVSVKLEQFLKGSYAYGAASGGLLAGWRTVTPALVCAGEDVNGNGVLEAGEDVDGDGRLEPRPSDVSVTLLQAKTRVDGTAELQIKYPQNFATWVNAKITVSANGVVGTEGRDTFTVAPLPAPADAFTNQNVAPAFARSPYGVVTTGDCSNPN